MLRPEETENQQTTVTSRKGLHREVARCQRRCAHKMSANTAKHELIGVGFLCIDRLEYLLDHDETIAIVSFSGFPVGNIKLTVRGYVDEVEPLPRTIITHVEANIQNFMDHTFIVNFYFDYISGLPENHCTDTYVSFKFMSHMPTYTTPQYLGYSTEPSYESTIQVTKPITASLIDYLRTGCMEFKVFAIRSRGGGQMEETKGVDTPQSNAAPKQLSSWRSVGSPGMSGSPSRNASFRGDKAALERKLTQATSMAEALLNEKRATDEHAHEVEEELRVVLRENEALRSELQSARAEIDNMYNINGGDGVTILSNHDTTNLPSASRGASFRSSTFSRFYQGSANNSEQASSRKGKSSVCAVM